MMSQQCTIIILSKLYHRLQISFSFIFYTHTYSLFEVIKFGASWSIYKGIFLKTSSNMGKKREFSLWGNTNMRRITILFWVLIFFCCLWTICATTRPTYMCIFTQYYPCLGELAMLDHWIYLFKYFIINKHLFWWWPILFTSVYK